MAHSIIYVSDGTAGGLTKGKIASIVQGQSGQSITLEVRDLGNNLVDLTGYSTITGRKRDASGNVTALVGTLTLSGTPTVAPQVTFALDEDDGGESGFFTVIIILSNGVNTLKSFPATWHIQNDPAVNATTAAGTVGVTEAQALLLATLATTTGLAEFNGTGGRTAIVIQSFMRTFLAAATVIAARIGLLPSYASNAAKVLAVNATADDVEWVEQSGATEWGDITGTLSDQTDLQSALDDKSDKLITESVQAGTSYTFALADADTIVRSTNGSAVTFTVPANATIAFEVGTVIGIRQAGAGALSLAAAGGVTIEGYPSGSLQMVGQGATATIYKIATDTWVLAGQVVDTSLGTMATQDANNVNITGGSIANISDLAIGDGGTGASTAQDARLNLLPTIAGNTLKVLRVNAGETDYELVTLSTSSAWGSIAGTLSDQTDLTTALNGKAALASGNTFAAAQLIDGAADTIQMRVQGHSTQTAKTLTVENSAGTVMFSVSNAGLIDATDIQFGGDANARLYRSSTNRVETAANFGVGSIFYVGNNQSILRNGSEMQLGNSFATILTPATFASVANDATANAVTNIFTAGHNTTGTPANGLGAGILFNLETSTTINTTAGQVAAAWDDVTHASRSSRMTIKAAGTSGLVDGVAVDDDATASNTRLLVYDVDNGTLERVSVGAADTGGAGFKVLRIPN